MNITESLKDVFTKEMKSKKMCHVKWHDAKIHDCSYAFHIVLGTCVSVILCGIDNTGKVWIGANHLFKSREEDSDMALRHVAKLYNGINEKNVNDIKCVGVFGAGYSKDSLAKNIAKKNILTIIEALDLFNLTIEQFHTGFSQELLVLKSDIRNSILIRHYNIKKNEKSIIEIPLTRT